MDQRFTRAGLLTMFWTSAIAFAGCVVGFFNNKHQDVEGFGTFISVVWITAAICLAGLNGGPNSHGPRG